MCRMRVVEYRGGAGEECLGEEVGEVVCRTFLDDGRNDRTQAPVGP